MTLIRAVASGDLTTLQQTLLDHEVDVNRPLDTGETLLHLAVGSGNAAIIKTLLDAGADPNAAHTSGEVPLHQASARGLVDMVRLLYANGADAKLPTPRTGETNLHLATRGGHLQLVEFLLQHGASVNVKSRLRQTPLASALSTQSGGAEQYVDIVKRLLENGASANGTGDEQRDVDQKTLKRQHKIKEPETPLHLAIATGNVAMVRVLVQGGADVNVVDNTGCPPLNRAVESGDVIIVDLLLRAGANANVKGELMEEEVRPWIGERRYCPLHIAAASGRCDLAEMLLDVGGASVDTPTTDFAVHERPWCWIVHKETALHLAADGGYTDLCRLLTRRGADLDNIDVEGNMPHHLSLHGSHHETLHALLLRGCPLNARDGDHKPALHQAIRLRDARSVLLLLMHGASVNQRRKQQRSFLQMLSADSTWGPEVFGAYYHSGNTTCRLIRQPEVELRDLTYSEERLPIYTWLLDQYTDVQPLKILTRWLIRRIFREVTNNKSIWIYIDNLPIPRTMKKYLLLYEYNQYPVEYAVCPVIYKSEEHSFPASPISLGFNY